MNEEIPPINETLLEGRTVVIDPGHGLGALGAIGKGGITEAEVNLRVALYLAEALRKYGATVILTRAVETTLPTDDGEHVREDLKRRVEFANFMQADLFLSIHHNSSLNRGERYNAIETYYKMGDEGPSLDAGRAIHEHLVRNLGIIDNFLLPGNYFLLRNSEGPAVLGEASYISNPSMAKKLRKKDKLYLEAQAYLLGVLDYFSKGRPVIRPNVPLEDTVYTAMPVLEFSVTPGDGGSPIDIASITLLRNGERVRPSHYRLEGDKLRYTPISPLASGIHHFELRARNLQGNSAVPFRFSVTVILPAETVDLHIRPEAISPGNKSLTLIEAYVRDKTGSPVADGKEVRFWMKGPGERSWIRRTKGGRASLLFPATKAGRVSFSVGCDGVEDRKTLVIEKPLGAQVLVILRDGISDQPIADVAVTLRKGGRSYTSLTSSEGFTCFSADFEGLCTLQTQKRGYHLYKESINLRKGELVRVDLGLNPVQGGVLANKVVVIDADHTPSMDPMIQGYRSSDLNIMVANRLRMLLEASGTNAIMIRTADIPMSPVHRVVKSAGGGAEMHVIVRHSPIVRGNRVVISHYPRSVAGEWFANLLREEMAHLGWKRIVVREEASIVMRHTPSPTVSVNVQTGREVGESDHPVDPSIRLEAYAIYNALLRYFGAVEEDHSELYGVVQDEEGAPLGAAYVAVDGVLTLRADEKGRFHLRLLDSGYHELFAVAEGFVGWSHDLFIDSGRPDSVRIVLERDAGGP